MVPEQDSLDFADAERGLIAGLEPRAVTTADGRPVWDTAAFDYLDGDCPPTVNPSLWRQTRLCAKEGLFEVVEGVYQIRGIDLSNMSLLETDSGVLVVDPLVSAETAAAGLALYRAHRGDRPVTGVLYTHSHFDHFGGVLGVLDPGLEVPILAPEGFMEHAVSENVYAGTAMLRRSAYYGGVNLDRGPRGLVGMGLGLTASTGTPGLLAPTRHITATGQEEVVDGLRLVFQLTPGTEAPSEMNFLLPDRRALCMAENATHTMHNLLTLRGAEVRDARVWSRYLNEALQEFAPRAEVVFASHHWPTWGSERITAFLTAQRDLYAYLHDQTLRLLNQGYTGPEIAEQLTLPPELESTWSVRGYYGSLSHNVKAISQRYLGWYDGNPSSLWPHPPRATGQRYVQLLGGIDTVIARGREFADAGDLRFAAQLLQHAVFADPDHLDAREALAAVYEQLGFGAENGTWRNCYLAGAQELRGGIPPMLMDVGSSMATALSIDQLFDSLAVRVDGTRAAATTAVIDWAFTDLNITHRTQLSHGALIHWDLPRSPAAEADAAYTLTKPQLLALLAGHPAETLTRTGDPDALTRLLGVLDRPDPAFPIVTPRTGT
ncbi:alkyl sulfatase dimerization domain-containing protein [Nocardia sp. NPDC050697]|uniref:alkyl/aryl-sulfatase n=1 Tax=Nocardia sp. NPDC050697 TaxID=3155158 RepID=UPI003410FB0A